VNALIGLANTEVLSREEMLDMMTPSPCSLRIALAKLWLPPNPSPLKALNRMVSIACADFESLVSTVLKYPSAFFEKVSSFSISFDMVLNESSRLFASLPLRSLETLTWSQITIPRSMRIRRAPDDTMTIVSRDIIENHTSPKSTLIQ